MANRPEVLIEKWFPLDVIGAESMRDASAAQKPPLNRLHVWWARRPLTTSRAAILASVLPSWQPDWPEHLKNMFPSEEAYQQWFLKLCGIFGDPVAGRKLITWAKDKGIKLDSPPYTHARAFTVNPSSEYLDTLSELLQLTWGKSTLSVLDPFAGGGSIPFEALRYRFETKANELNPVASVILKATLEYPVRFGAALTEDIDRYGATLCMRIRERLEPYFPARKLESIQAYIWTRTVPCPYTGKTLPLTPNWWLKKDSDAIGIEAVFDGEGDAPVMRIVRGAAACKRSGVEDGTTRRGKAVSPWARNQPVTGEYIKSEARAGRMGQFLLALALKGNDGLTFSLPTADDLSAVTAAEDTVTNSLPKWESLGLLPTEHRSGGRSDFIEPYGFNSFYQLFLPRQLLAMVTAAQCFADLKAELKGSLPHDRFEAIVTYLALAFDKALDYDSAQCPWHPTRQIVAHTFNLHDFRIRWNPAEFDASRNLFPWAVHQVVDAYGGLVKLVNAPSTLHESSPGRHVLSIVNGNALSMDSVELGSVDHITVDPPYYDNVMYAECADFFYVWMKRNIGDVFPSLFVDELTNKEEEAVSNSSRFKSLSPKAKKRTELAGADYERKMLGAFREMNRVLRDDGVLTVMFTHKQVAAWDALATSLIAAGFTIESSWPVHTESESSLHIAKKNAAKSTILLTCRKRETAGEPVWWDDLKGRVRQVAREKAAVFEKEGITGVDLYISTFGPVLSILSENWPVLTSEVDDRTGEPKALRPEVALDLAREEVIDLRKQGLLLGRTVQFDHYTDWYLMAWDAFKAEEFPGDEARKLALALGLDLEKDVIASKRLLSKKSSTVVLRLPKDRRKRDMVDEDKTSFECWIDAVHTAMMLYEEDGAKACEQFLKKTGLMTDGTFKACIQALLNAIPRTKAKDKFVRPEAATLEAMRLAFFDDLTVPVEEEVVDIPVQTEMGMEELEEEMGDDSEDEEEDA